MTERESKREWQKEWPSMHYEPEHESGQTCWCKPNSIVRGETLHIEHNEQREVLEAFITSIEKEARADALNEVKAILAKYDMQDYLLGVEPALKEISLLSN